MENHAKDSQKLSKLAVFLFVLAVLDVLGFLTGGVSYASPLQEIITVVVTLLIAYWAYYVSKRARKLNLGGSKLASYAMYAFVVVLACEVIASGFLAGSSRDLRSFATKETPQFFSANLEGLKANATDELNRKLTEGTVSAVKKEFADVGAIQSCVFEKTDESSVSYGGSMNFNSVEYGLSGDYGMSCYGEKKPFDVTVHAKYQNGSWKVDDYSVNTNLEKGFIDDSGINTVE